jgi:hypothetical protein
MPKKALSVHTDDLVRDYKAGMYITHIARKWGINPKTVAARLKRAGVASRGRHRAIRLTDSVIAMRYEQGASVNQLSKELGADRITITRRLAAQGVKLRGHSEAEALKWSRLKKDRRKVERQCSAAWRAVRGRKVPPASIAKGAITRMKNLWRVGNWENEVAAALWAKNVPAIQQFAFDTCNLDIAIPEERIAVEIMCGSPNRRYLPKFRERVPHLVNAGWRVLFIYCSASRKWRDQFDPAVAAEDVIAFREFCGRLEPERSGYRVIRRDGQSVTPPRLQFDDLPRI